MTPLPFSSAQIDRLSERLRDSESVSADDLARLHELLLAYEVNLQAVAEDLRALGLQPTTRLKTTGTILDKLRRERPITLRGIRDLAGARIVQRMTLDEQDDIRDRLLGLWPEARVIDRRAEPNNGYRAVHVVPRVGGCQVEVQVRTYYQDTWAQTMEWFADRWGRQIRYGEPPAAADEMFTDRLTRNQVIGLILDTSSTIAHLEEIEAARVRAERHLPREDLGRMDEEIERMYGGLRTLLRDLRGSLGLPS